MTGTNLGPFEATTVLLIGCSLAAVAGFVNATTLLSVLEQTPSHVTGITTKAAIAYATGDTLSGTESFIALIGLFTSFVLGAFTTGMFAMGETWKLGNRCGNEVCALTPMNVHIMVIPRMVLERSRA